MVAIPRLVFIIKVNFFFDLLENDKALSKLIQIIKNGNTHSESIFFGVETILIVLYSFLTLLRLRILCVTNNLQTQLIQTN